MLDASAAAPLRDALHAAGYTSARVREAIGAVGDGLAPRPAQVPLLLAHLREEGPFATLVKLFVLAVPVPRREAARSLAPLPLAEAVASGLLADDGDEVRANVRLIPWEDLVLAADIATEGDPSIASDHVMGVTASSTRLAHLTIRRPVATALDVGTGSGIQALLAARHAASVVATDVATRSVEFAAFNAGLNAAPNVEVREGSLFEPAGDGRYDLIVSNPPFVISPDTAALFRDAGMEGDEVSRRVVDGAAERLTEGGYAFVLANWGHAEADEWSERPRAWLEGSGCDAVLIRFSTFEPFDYASSWNRPLEHDTAAYASAVERWLRSYATLGIEAITYGAVVLRRRDGANWVWAETAPSEQIERAADHIARIVDAQDFLQGLPEREGLLDEVLAVAEAHHLDQRLRFRDGGPEVESATLRLDEGLRFEAGVDAPTAHILAGLDGRRTVAEALREAAEIAATHGVDRAEFIAAALPPIERMLALGFLIRVPR